MQITNLATVAVATTAGGTEILSAAVANAALAKGLNCAVINPSVDIVLVDNGGLNPSSTLPGAVVGTVANSPFVCPANVSTVILHRGGSIRGISTNGTATTKIGVACAS